jgi:acyl-coenzyme A synthetase/AMP-(fatty) acid ligase
MFPGSVRDRAFLRSRGATTSVGQFLALAHSLAATLPDRPAALNLCERRDNFLVAFAAMLIRDQACVLPPSRVPAVVNEVMDERPGSYVLDDAYVEQSRPGQRLPSLSFPTIPSDRVVVIGYTSGSTARPRPNPKTWGCFAACTALNASRLGAASPALGEESLPWIVATVPPQHMYGMELSVLMPLLGGMGIHGGRPLYPADIVSALADVPGPRVLVSTPMHLRALLESGVDLPQVGAVVSATAPLPTELARTIERRFGTVLLEYFGSTETCIVASRRTAVDDAWNPYPGVRLQPAQDGTQVDAPWLTAPVLLQDVLGIRSDGTFTVRGRNADMVEVAGKRASLADLTRRLASIPGVADAVVFQSEDADSTAVRRLAALVVADGMTAAAVLEKLAEAVDPAFLPRPLVLVPRLPRNEVGKLPREQLLAALKR